MNRYQLICEAYDLVCENGMIGGSIRRKLSKGFYNLSPDVKSMMLDKQRKKLAAKKLTDILSRGNKLAATKLANNSLSKINNAFNAQSPLTKMASSFKK